MVKAIKIEQFGGPEVLEFKEIEIPKLNPNEVLVNNMLAAAQNDQMVLLTDGTVLNNSLYCMCKGKIQSEFMVYCETGEDKCPNGGWVHPQCT